MSSVVDARVIPSVMGSRVTPAVGAASVTAKTSGSEAYYKSNLDLVVRENKQLKNRLEQLEKENRVLKKSVYDLSARHCACMDQLGKGVKPFNIDSIETLPDLLESSPSEAVAGSQDQARAGNKAQSQAGSRFFHHKCDLKGHSGAVYTAAFSGTENLLATGSFDQTVRVWDTHAQRELAVLQEHQLHVADIQWSADSTILLSGSWDRSVCEWDVGAGKLLQKYTGMDGFVQVVRFNPSDNDVFVVATTQRQMVLFDRRIQALAMALENDTSVNSLYYYRNGFWILSGDNHGALKVWDVRQATVLDTVYNEEKHRAISSLAATHPCQEEGEEEGRFLAVNSYDNVLRMYERFSSAGTPPDSQQQAQSTPLSSMRCLHSLPCIRNNHWTIRSSFFQGHEYRRSVGLRFPPLPPGEKRSRRSSQDQKEVSVQESLLLATGSADNTAYLFDVSGPEGCSELLQQLEGHTDRVYSAIFHPSEPILATCSADFLVKLWTPKAL